MEQTPRRAFTRALAALAFARVVPAWSQPKSGMPRLGFLATYSESANPGLAKAFRDGMRELGYVDGKDYEVVYRFAAGDNQRLGPLAAELLAQRVDLIIAPTTAAAIAARSKTRELPIVIVTSGVPVEAGLARTLARPGGNVTGLTNLGGELLSKRLELMREVLPAMKRVGFLAEPSRPSQLLVEDFRESAGKFGFLVVPVEFRNRQDISAAFDKIQREKVDALFISPTVANVGFRDSLVAAAAQYRIPAMYGSTEFVEQGGLISYSTNFAEQYRVAAGYVARILKGAKPGDLPIEQPRKYDLVINLRTAKALGLAIPQSLLLRADRIID